MFLVQSGGKHLVMALWLEESRSRTGNHMKRDRKCVHLCVCVCVCVCVQVCSHIHGRVSSGLFPSSYKATGIQSWELYLMTLPNPNHLPQAPPPNTTSD
jgi:hypothetical protein